jgi:hypothetical protein
MVCLPHIVMVPEKGSKGKIDPSRGLAPGGADTLAAGRNGPAALQGCADAGSWPAAAVAVVRRRGKRGCNTDGRDHSARRSKTPPDIRCRGKCAAAKPLRREPPCPSQTGGWTTAAVHVRLEPVGCGDPLRVAGGTRPVQTAGFRIPPPSATYTNSSEPVMMIGRMIVRLRRR